MSKREADQEKIQKILEKRGYKNGEVPKGKEIHHIKPLVNGGKDTPGNLVVLSKKKHQQIHKKRREREEE